MKAPTAAAVASLAKQPPIQIAVAALILAGGLYLLTRKAVSDTARGVATAINDVNKGTSYEGAGVFGTLGNAFNALSGGSLEWLGEKIGGGLADIRDKLGASSEMRAGYTAAALSSPVRPEHKARFNVG